MQERQGRSGSPIGPSASRRSSAVPDVARPADRRAHRQRPRPARPGRRSHRGGPRLFFHHADRRKAGRNRLHLDITVTTADGDDRPRAQLLAEEKDRLVGLGASVVRLVDQRWGPWPEHYWQLRDPEGNEFCLQ